MEATAPLLAVEGLTLDFLAADGAPVRVLDAVDLAIRSGETLALVGESGSGKSVTSLAIMGLVDRRAARIGGAIRLGGRDLLGLSPRAMRPVRGGEAAMIFQEPMTSLNPVLRVGGQIAASLRLHRGLPARAAAEAAVERLAEVGIPDPARRARAYPHELSGGMRQRVLIALALACDPRLLIADEPTTALDVTIQAQILDLLKRIQEERGTAILFITHNLAVVAEIADRVAVMYGGRVVEEAPAREIFTRPRHPYTRGLLDSLPAKVGGGGRARLCEIPGAVVDLRDLPPGCAFSPRCGFAAQPCRAAPPPFLPVGPARASRCIRWEML